MVDMIGRVCAALLLVGWGACAVKVVCDAAMDFDRRTRATSHQAVDDGNNADQSRPLIPDSTVD